MRKTAFFPLILPFFLGLSFVLDGSGIYKTFVYAEDLGAFQQEIVLAKQKHQAILHKADSVTKALDRQTRIFLGQDPDRPLGKFDTESIARGPDRTKLLESPPRSSYREPRLVPSAPRKTAPKAPEAARPKTIKPKEKAKAGGGIFPWKRYREKEVRDSEMLYKVAVSDNKISEDEAVEVGLAGNLQLKAAEEKIEVSKSKLFEAKRALFPTVQGVAVPGSTAGGKQPTSSGSTGFPSPRIFKTEYYKVNVSQPLFYGGELVATVRQAQESLRSQEAEYRKVKHELVHQIRAAYLATVKAEYNAQYQADLQQKAGAVREKVEAAYKEKLLSEVDALNVESQVQQALFQLRSAENDRLSALVSLRQAMNLNEEVPLPLDLRLEFQKVTPDPNELFEKALQYNPEYLSKEYALRSARHAVEVYLAKKRPHFDLRGSYGVLGERIFDDLTYSTAAEAGANGQEIDFNLNKEWFLGVRGSMPIGPNSFEWEQIKHVYAPSVISPTGGSEDWSQKFTFNLFDKLSEITDEKSAYAALAQVKAEQQKIKNDLALKIRDDSFALQKALIQIDSSTAKVRYQEKQNAVLEYLLSLQETSPSNLLEGYIDLAQSKFSFIQAVVDYRLAVSSLGVSAGDPDTFKTQAEKKHEP
ncbi:MAG: TolC family protein [Candidatus Omnitrophica bacterium]|nr:TolC family protein [Candidatus Omnitrophota bacterium]